MCLFKLLLWERHAGHSSHLKDYHHPAQNLSTVSLHKHFIMHCFQMPDQIALMGKACGTLVTLEWLGSSMASEVQLKVGWGRKLFSTKITRIHFFIDFL